MNGELRREVGIFGATMMGLGSIIGTGVFVSIGIAAGIAGPSVVLAIVIAALVAIANGLSSAQLAASHPTSGGTYEYGYRYLTAPLGFAAGWMFLCAKSASAATAALGFAGYVLNALDLSQSRWHIPLALGAVVILTLVVLSGIRRSSAINIAIVSITLSSLLFFIVAGLPMALSHGRRHFAPFFLEGAGGPMQAGAAFFEAAALMFVAYTGYGRVATLGEEIQEPRVNIPRAIILTLLISMLLYVAVAVVGVAAVGVAALGEAGSIQAAPLEIAARHFPFPGVDSIISVGAVTAMLGVLLNLLLGLSRVLLAMARRRDMPAVFERLDSSATPFTAVMLVGVVIAGLVLIGNVKTTWSFSAFTVLVYYALTNLAALRLPMRDRMYARIIPWLGLTACLFLAFWVEARVWLAGIALLGLGFVWHFIAQRISKVGWSHRHI